VSPLLCAFYFKKLLDYFFEESEGARGSYCKFIENKRESKVSKITGKNRGTTSKTLPFSLTPERDFREHRRRERKLRELQIGVDPCF